jgi:hypothetical protein
MADYDCGGRGGLPVMKRKANAAANGIRDQKGLRSGATTRTVPKIMQARKQMARSVTSLTINPGF